MLINIYENYSITRKICIFSFIMFYLVAKIAFIFKKGIKQHRLNIFESAFRFNFALLKMLLDNN